MKISLDQSVLDSLLSGSHCWCSPMTTEYESCAHCKAEQTARKSRDINDIADEHYPWLVEMGWMNDIRPLEQLCLIASEVGEAADECRGVEPTENLKFELADIILRTCGFAKHLGIDIGDAIEKKMQKNRERGSKGRIK